MVVNIVNPLMKLLLLRWTKLWVPPATNPDTTSESMSPHPLSVVGRSPPEFHFAITCTSFARLLPRILLLLTPANLSNNWQTLHGGWNKDGRWNWYNQGRVDGGWWARTQKQSFHPWIGLPCPDECSSGESFGVEDHSFAGLHLLCKSREGINRAIWLAKLISWTCFH